MIRWITQFLGTGPFTKVTLEEDMRILDVRDLVDKAGNDPSEIAKKIESGLAILKEGHRLVVACDYGISRSNSVASGILAAYEGIPFDEAAYRVVQETGEQEIKLGPLDSVRRALNQKEKKEYNENTILVTGGTGFVGQNFISHISGKHKVFAPTRDEIDLLKGATLLDLYVKKNNVTHFVHFAHPRIYTSNKAMGEALAMLRNALEVCINNNLYFIYPSVYDVYFGYKGQDVKANENTALNPKGPHGETKWLCESLINRYRSEYGLKCAIFRSSLLYGTGSDRPKFIYNFISKAKTNKPIFTHVFKNNEPAIDVLHVDDYSRALEAALLAKTNKDFCLGGGELIETSKIAKLICTILNSKSEIGSRQMDDDVVRISMDYSAATEALNWKPMISFEEGLTNLLKESVQHG